LKEFKISNNGRNFRKKKLDCCKKTKENLSKKLWDFMEPETRTLKLLSKKVLASIVETKSRSSDRASTSPNILVTLLKPISTTIKTALALDLYSLHLS
jgi:hypothetical protein